MRSTSYFTRAHGPGRDISGQQRSTTEARNGFPKSNAKRQRKNGVADADVGEDSNVAFPRAMPPANRTTKKPRRHVVAANGKPNRASAPDKNWTAGQLTIYAIQHLKDREDMNEQLAVIGRSSSVALFRAGHALQVLRDKLKVISAWEQTLVDEGIGKGTANEAIRLYNKATALWGAAAETELAKRTITEAKYELGVIKKKQKAKDRKNLNRKTSAKKRPPECTRADEYLIAVAHKLEEVVQWDRGDLDASQLEVFAQRCIKLLTSFLGGETEDAACR